MRYTLFAVVMVIGSALVGCAPDINISIPNVQETSAMIVADINANASSVQGPASLTIRTLPVSGPEDVAELGPMVPAGNDRYEAIVDDLNPTREHEAVVSIDYKPLFSATTKTKTASRIFSLPMTPGCFSFHNADEGTAGWTFVGIHDGEGKQDVTQPGCPVEGLLVRLQQSLDAGNGSLNVPITSVCFPTSTPSGQWRFDLVSPELSQDTAWQNIAGATFQVFSNVPVKVQPVIQFTDAEGVDRARAPADANGEFIFFDVAGQQTIAVDGLVQIPNGATVKRLRIRVFGVPEETVIGEGLIRVDAICPVPQQ